MNLVDSPGWLEHFADASNAGFFAHTILDARVGTLLVWTGEAGVRLYSGDRPGGARSDRLLYQVKLALDADLRLEVRSPHSQG